MTVVAVFMAWLSFHSTSTSSTDIPNSQRSPTWPLCDPANLCFTYGTLYPITSILLLNNNFTLGTLHSITFLQQFLQHFIGLLGSFVVGGPDAEVLLVLLAVHALVNGLTGQTVLLLTDWTREEVD